YLAYIDGPLRPDYIQRGQNGEIYSIHAPGVSVLVAPLFWMFGLRGAQATIIALAGLAGAFIWIAGWLAARDRGAAWFAWAAAVAVALVVWLRMTHGEVVSVSWLVFASGALALLPFLHTRFSALSAGLGAAVLLTVWRNRQIAPPQRIRYLAAFCVLPAIGAV